MLGRNLPTDNSQGAGAELRAWIETRSLRRDVMREGEGRMRWEREAGAGYPRLQRP